MTEQRLLNTTRHWQHVLKMHEKDLKQNYVNGVLIQQKIDGAKEVLARLEREQAVHA